MEARSERGKHQNVQNLTANQLALFSLLIIFPSFKNAHQDFSKMKQSNNESNLREEVLKNLAVANDNFVELVANLKEGTKVQ